MRRQRREVSNANGVAPKRPSIGKSNDLDCHRELRSSSRRFRQYRPTASALDHPANGVKSIETDADFQSPPGACRVMVQIFLKRAADRQADDVMVQDVAQGGRPAPDRE